MTTRFDPFDCGKWCQAGQRKSQEVQAKRLCTLPGFTRQWKQPDYTDMARMLTWQGRLPIVNEQGERQERPPEDLNEGCPGGWARSKFALSFMPFMRTRLENGAHDSNPRVGPDTPPHILDALRYFEIHQSRAEAEFQRLR